MALGPPSIGIRKGFINTFSLITSQSSNFNLSEIFMASDKWHEKAKPKRAGPLIKTGKMKSDVAGRSESCRCDCSGVRGSVKVKHI